MDNSQFSCAIDIKSLGTLILEELKLIRVDIKTEIERLCNEIQFLCAYNTKTTFEKSKKIMSDPEESIFQCSNSMSQQQQQCIKKLNDHKNEDGVHSINILSVSSKGIFPNKTQLTFPQIIKSKNSKQYESSNHLSEIPNNTKLLIDDHSVENNSVVSATAVNMVLPEHFIDNNTISSCEPKNPENKLKVDMLPASLYNNSIINEESTNIMTENSKNVFLPNYTDSNNSLKLFDSGTVVSSFTKNLPREEKSCATMVNFKCKFCSKSFAVYSNYLFHLKMHNNFNNKNTFCNLCFKTFSSKDSLGKHMICHSNTRKFICKYCDKRFFRKNELKIHLRIHTGEKPYTCNVCGNTFTHQATLTNHMRIHTGEKPYKCKICSKSFTHSSNLTRHMHIHINEKTQFIQHLQ